MSRPASADGPAQHSARTRSTSSSPTSPNGYAASRPGRRERTEVVRGLVREARAGFGSPTMLTYLPVLIERAVRDHLSAASRPDRHADQEDVTEQQLGEVIAITTHSASHAHVPRTVYIYVFLRTVPDPASR